MTTDLAATIRDSLQGEVYGTYVMVDRCEVLPKDERISVLLVASDGPAERSIVRTLKRRGMDAEWAKTAAELRLRADRTYAKAPGVVFLDVDHPALGEALIAELQTRFPLATLVALGVSLNGEHAARLLSLGVPSLNKPVSPNALADLASLLTERSQERARAHSGEDVSRARKAKGWVGDLEAALESYAMDRALSQQQRLILRFYLGGDNDKQIAQICSCSEATVYEHWRRMGKKAGGSTKADVISDFHRYLVGH